MREDGFYWIGSGVKAPVVAYYEKGTWLFCGSHYMFSDEDLKVDELEVLEQVIRQK